MDQLQHFLRTSRWYAYALLVFGNVLLLTTGWALIEFAHFDPGFTYISTLILAVLLPLIFVRIVSSLFERPITYLWQAIMYVAPETTNVPAPDIKNLKHGRELVTNLISHVYRLADVSQDIAKHTTEESQSLSSNFVANSLPLPLVVLDKDENVLFANRQFMDYVHKDGDEVIKQSIYSLLDMSFTTDQTFDAWLSANKDKTVNASNVWERVRLTQPDPNDPMKQETRLFDLAAYYNKSNPSGYETMLVLFDHTKQYSVEDNALNFIELAVHELRAPLTMLRGYIEVFQEELTGKVSVELEDYLQKIQVASEQLSTFVNNILNVARVEDDQMLLNLHEENWTTLLQDAAKDLALRARMRGIKIKTEIAPDLPTVGCDPTSMYEVLSNLVDNAMKYSATGKEIFISSHLTSNGMIETTVKDFGVGIPTTALPRIFDKFYRDPHNRTQVGGTGLGLYLGKMVVEAHGGNIWVQSKEGQGTTIGFTLLPYAKLAEGLKNGNNKDVVRSAHGWIKNHSMYRR